MLRGLSKWFKASCVNLTEQWLEMSKMGKEEVDMLRKKKTKFLV